MPDLWRSTKEGIGRAAERIASQNLPQGREVRALNVYKSSGLYAWVEVEISGAGLPRLVQDVTVYERHLYRAV